MLRAWMVRACIMMMFLVRGCSSLPTVRLVGGETEYEGRLEVYRRGRWGTVCEDSLNDRLATVVCRSLGLPWNRAKAFGGAIFGEGSGPVWLQEVNCVGTETRIEACDINQWESYSCDHSNDLSIICFSPNETAIRLVEGKTEYEGRLEVFKFGRWGTVCGNTENNTLSDVVCRSLGLPWETSEAYESRLNGDMSSGPIWIKDFICVGSETSIDECEWRWNAYCDHSFDVSINCLPPNDTVRLVGGATEYEGRLEVYYNGVWGTLCDNYLDDKLSAVVCRTLRFPSNSSEAYGKAAYGQGTGTIWSGNFQCNGAEKNIKQCEYYLWESDCQHKNDVSINCLPQHDVKIRLVGGATQYEGRVEVYKNRKWGTVCDNVLGDKLADVICRSLGVTWDKAEIFGGAIYGQGSGPIWYNEVNCTGMETNIEQCQHKHWEYYTCYHDKDISINCFPSNDTAVRLVGGATEYEGRLEVYKLGRWGTVCESNINNKMALKMAAVVCRSLGLPWNTSEAYSRAVYGRGSGSIWLDGVNCEGSETSIDECDHKPWGSHECSHWEDVSINCFPNDTAFRLAGGSSKYEGRLEVYKHGTWGTVCGNKLNDELAVIVCRSLGFPWNRSELYDGDVYLQDPVSSLLAVDCEGSEDTIQECEQNVWNNCWNEVSINCLPPEDRVRLVGGPTEYEGRLEVYKSGDWGTVCDDNLSNKLAAVVCRSLRLPWKTSEVYGGATYGEGSGSILRQGVDCTGFEESIDDCENIYTGSNCYHSNDVSVNCLPPKDTVRLAGGKTVYEGRLEVFRNGKWGTVCDDNINEKVSVVVCRLLGLPWYTSTVYGGAVYGQGSGPIWLTYVRCVGTEEAIEDCNYGTWGVHNCDHSEDVSVNCLPPVVTVRLVGGPTRYEGRLEVYKNGRWGTVCGYILNHKISDVVCRSLGLPWNRSEGYVNGIYGQGSGPIWFDNLSCVGTETRIQDCSHGAFVSSNCDHSYDVSINCMPPTGENRLFYSLV